MAYTKVGFEDRIVEYPHRYMDQNSNELTLTRSEGTVTKTGTPLTSGNLNKLDEGIKTLDTNVGDTSTLETEATTVVGAINEVRDEGVYVGATEPTGDDRKKNWFQKGINLFDGLSESGAINQTTGLNVDSSIVYRTVNYIEVNPSTIYYLSEFGNSCRVFCYDEDYNFLANYGTYFVNFPLTTSSDCKYIRVYATASNLGDIFQVEQGYVNPKMWILNDNDVYEVFMEKYDIEKKYPFSVYVSTTATYTDLEIIKYNTVEYDNDGVFDTSIYSFKAPVDGIYSLSGKVCVLSPTDQKRYGFAFYKNGVQEKIHRIQSSGTGSIFDNFITMIKLSKGDLITLNATFDNSKEINGGSGFTWFEGYLVERT